MRKINQVNPFIMLIMVLTSCTSGDRGNIFDPGSVAYEPPSPMSCLVPGANQEKECVPRGESYSSCAAEYGEAQEFAGLTQADADSRCVAARPYLSCKITIAGRTTCRAPGDPQTCADVAALGLGAVTPVEEASAGSTANCAKSL
jgi:hypothetical protein